MGETESLSISMENGLKQPITELSETHGDDKQGSEFSSTVEKLLLIGSGAEKAGLQEKVTGPIDSISRPFSTAEFGGEQVQVDIQVSSDTLSELHDVFDCAEERATREALRLGVILVQANQLGIEGSLGIYRPFAHMDIEDELQDETSVEAFKTISTHENSSNIS